MLTQEQVMDIFKESGALLEGHFLLTSGKHSDRYIQCAQVLKFPHHTEKLVAQLVKQVTGPVDLVIGPAMGGIIVAYEAARALGVPALFTERQQGEMMLRRGFVIEPGQKVLVVEDVVTTGGSVKEVIDIVTKLGGEVVAVGTLVDRSAGPVDFGAPLVSALKLNITTYEADACPLCVNGSKAIKPGSRT